MRTYCPWCMNLVRSDDICPVCHKNPDDYLPSSHHFPPGQRLKERYVVGRALGEGGFGITYLGWDTNLERKVAIKEYFPTAFVKREVSVSLEVTCYTNVGRDYYEKGRDQFLQEARTMAKLEGIPEIVRVLDFFPANNTAYIVMEFLEGRTLKEWVAERGRIPAKELLDMLEPVLRAMEAMHRAGVIHRDISPDNLMVLKNGRVKLMDFGCARDIEGGHTMTVTLKHGFAPIEQYTGRGQGPWSDVYSLSATMYYCLTGKIPTRSVERSDSDQDPLVLPNALGAGLTENQSRALVKGLAVRARNRWQSVSDLYAALYGITMDGIPWTPQPEQEEPDGKTEHIRREAAAGQDGKQSGTDGTERERRPSPFRAVMARPKAVRGAIAAAACLVIILAAVIPMCMRSAAEPSGGNQQDASAAGDSDDPAKEGEASPGMGDSVEEERQENLEAVGEAPGIAELPAEDAPADEETPPAQTTDPEPAKETPPAEQTPSQKDSAGSGGSSGTSSSGGSGTKDTTTQTATPPASSSEEEDPDAFSFPKTGFFEYGSYVLSSASGGSALELVGFTDSYSGSTLTLPAQIEGYPVISAQDWEYTFATLGVTELTVPTGYKTIAFFCDSPTLTSLNIGNGVTVAGVGFRSCSNLTTVTIGSNCTINPCAFAFCPDITNLTFGSGCRIYQSAFTESVNLKSVTLPADCKYQEGAFPSTCEVSGGMLVDSF